MRKMGQSSSSSGSSSSRGCNSAALASSIRARVFSSSHSGDRLDENPMMKTKELQSVQKCWRDDFKEGKTSVDVRVHEPKTLLLNASSSGNQHATENLILLSRDTNFENSDSRSGQKGVALREENHECCVSPWAMERVSEGGAVTPGRVSEENVTQCLNAPDFLVDFSCSSPLAKHKMTKSTSQTLRVRWGVWTSGATSLKSIP